MNRQSHKLTKKQQRNIGQHQRNWAKAERKQKLAEVRKKAGRGPKAKRTRQKEWLPTDIDPLDAEALQEALLDGEQFSTRERIMPLGEGERRRELEKLAQKTPTKWQQQKGDDVDQEPAAPPAAGEAGRVIEVASGLCRVKLADDAGEVETDAPPRVLLCTVRGALSEGETGFTNVVAVGDNVLVQPEGEAADAERGVVVHVAPRRTILARPDVFHSHLRQVLVANADQLLIVASWREPHFWPELVDRYIVVAERSNLPAVLCINKIDLAPSREEVQKLVHLYEGLGVKVLLTSAETGEGIDELRGLLADKLSVLSGLSGVGKSTLLNSIAPELDIRTGETSERKHEGKHTTTQATLYELDKTGTVVDTPGIRNFGVAGIAKEALIGYFPELAEAAAQCRFANCTHESEPKCAVRSGIEKGELAESRLYSYRKILATLQ